FVEGYSLENGIRTTNSIITFPELDMLLTIDKITFENAFINDASSENDVDSLYKVIAAVDTIKSSYDSIIAEIEKINNFIGDYDTLVLIEHDKVKDYIHQKLFDFGKNRDK